ncbi:hypothetical protein OKA04_09020 [Luteolibacter flavescens]|uniref:Uncharacterized protein n=1 Tax=Luteolibacter flavescens TaxID=1859460 RepID=A0ABT3FMT7_9BACT|nr:hypothetical protein [Luteolibacter flavescens]MCW1884868.1 hypothetical protein [Luteolibacter flavescens]
MREDDPLSDEAEEEIGTLRQRGEESGWAELDRAALFHAFDRWLAHPRLLDHADKSFLRFLVLNEITFLISHPLIGDHAWEYIRNAARQLGPEDPHGLRDAWIISTFELAAESPEDPDFLEKLFSLAADEGTRWAVFGAYKNLPWRLRLHAHRYSKGLITDEDCDLWLIEQGHGEDEILMQKSGPGE